MSPVCCGGARDARQEGSGSRPVEMSGNEVLAARCDQRRKLGDFAGRIRMGDDFDEWPPDLQKALGMTAVPSKGQ